MNVIPIIFKPLGFAALEAIQEDIKVSAEEILGELLGNEVEPVQVLRARHSILQECGDITLVPRHEVILRHVTRPLAEARQCYLIGMPIAAIAQAGLVGEMVALWRFRMLKPVIDGKPLDADMQKKLWGREFDKLGQEQRVTVLDAIDDLDGEVKQAFSELRSIRRQYLHFMSDKSEEGVEADAVAAIRYATTLVRKTLTVEIREGMVNLSPKVMEFVKEITGG